MMQGEFLYREEDEVFSIYFLMNGDSCMVFERYKNVPYLRIEKGEMFGITDIYSSMVRKELSLDDWYSNKDLLLREFTVQAKTDSEVLVFNIKDFHKMASEFPFYYEKTKAIALLRMKALAVIKVKAHKVVAKWHLERIANVGTGKPQPELHLEVSTFAKAEELARDL